MARAKQVAGRASGGLTARHIWLHYFLAVALVMGLLVAGTVMQYRLLDASAKASDMISRVERLGMLSQRILLLAAEVAKEGDTEDSNALKEAAAEFGVVGRAIAGLRGSNPATDPGARLFGLAEAAVAAPTGSKAAEEAIAALRTFDVDPFLHKLEATSRALSEDARATREAFHARHRTTLVLVAVLLALEGALVFWPTHRALVASFDALQSKNQAIRRQNAVLEDHARALAYSAEHDPLTGLKNRKSLHDFLEAVLASERPCDCQVCVLHIDLDYFKELNDRLGHATGDSALKRVADIMRSRVRRSDIVSRVGGDEFVIAMTSGGGLTADMVHDICEDLIRRIREPMVVSGADIQLGASIGYAFADASAWDADALIANADMALYEAKRAGKGVARSFTGRMQDRVTRRNEMVLDMERALHAGEFVPYFQPLVALGGEAVVGVEMLARWAHTERGLIHPSDFMDVADEIGMVDAIEARVLIDGLDGLAALRQEGRPIPRLSLNASTRTMRYDDYAERLTDAVTARGFGPPDIVVEVLETTLVAETQDQTARTVSKLRELGYNVYVEGFGTGYSSLLNLASLDVNGVKIDRSLISEIEEPRARQIVGAIIGLARAMDLTVVAEGLGTTRQLELLTMLGADSGQGHGIAAPMTVDDLNVWFERRKAAKSGATARMTGTA